MKNNDKFIDVFVCIEEDNRNGEKEMEDYKIRFIKEYKELKERYEKLHKIIVKAEAGVLNFELACPLDLLKHQAKTMGEYLHILEVRSEIEGVDING